MVRISPLPREDWSAELDTFVTGFRSAVQGDRSDEGRQSGANLLGTLAQHPALAQAFLTFNGHLLYGSTLSARQRELLILRVATLQRSDYEWAQHAILGRKLGLDDSEIEAVATGPDAAQWSAADRALLRAADELLDDSTIGATTWAALAQEFDHRQLMDIVFTVGTYSMLAMALRAFAVEPEEGLIPHLPVRR
jgi:alkylhydroperoxidase family enzyme